MKIMQLLSLLLLFGLIVQNSAFADDGSSEEINPLKETTSLLGNQKERSAAIRGNSAAEAADDRATSAVGIENKEALYGLSAHVLEDMAKKNNGDSNAMSLMLEQAQKDPEGFARALSPEVQKQISDMAKRAPAASH